MSFGMEQSLIASGGENQPSKELLPHTDIDVSQLPLEMLTKIFQKLSTEDKGRVVQVCRAWRNVGYQPEVWCDLEAEVSLDENFNPFLIPSLAKRGVCKVKVTDLSGHRLRDLMDGIPNMTNLDLDGCKGVNDKTLIIAFSKKMPHLSNLNMTTCPKFTETSVALFTIKFKNLHFLSLVNCPQLTDTSLLLIAKGLLHLKTLFLGVNKLITNEGIGHLSGIDGHKADGHCQLSFLSFYLSKKLTNRALNCLTKGQANLETLYLRYCKKITGVGIKHVSKLAKLSEVCLQGINFGDYELLQLSIGKASINHLYLWDSGLTDDGLTTIGKMVYLRILNLSFCSQITPIGLKNLAEQGSRISTLIISNCRTITNNGLAHIAKLPYLEKLKLRSANFDITGLCNLAVEESKITNLNLTGCTLIDAQTLRIISSGLFSMQILVLDKKHVNDTGLALAARTLTKLTSLVSGTTELISEILKIRKTLC